MRRLCALVLVAALAAMGVPASAHEPGRIELRGMTRALRWAEEEARKRRSIFTLYAVMDRGGSEGMLWLAG